MLSKWLSVGLLALVPSLTIAESQAPNAGESQDPNAGKELATTCSACHGQDGVAVLPGAPNLAGQNARYLKTQLDLIKSNVRPVPQMAGMLDNKTPADLEKLAAYYSRLPAPVGGAQGDQIAMGEQIYRGGIAQKGVPACTACHSPSGTGNPPAGFPHLGGQRPDYVVVQLVGYREGTRVTDEAYGNAMRQIANGLTDGEIHALASYIQGLH